MQLPSPIPEPLIEPLSAQFQLLAEPMRLRIFDLLRRRGAASVSDIAAVLGTSQQNVSKHLGVLYRADVLGKRKDANRVLYSTLDRSLVAACEALYPTVADRLGYPDRNLGGPRWAGQPNEPGRGSG